jgi:hypothetical protein
MICPYCNENITGLPKHVVVSHPERSQDNAITALSTQHKTEEVKE